jgi:hypothetical protein
VGTEEKADADRKILSYEKIRALFLLRIEK